MADRVHQVGFTKSHAAIDIERIVGFPRRFRDRERGGVRELIARTDDESLKRALRIEREFERLDVYEIRRARS
jgi:hypothetical protein